MARSRFDFNLKLATVNGKKLGRGRPIECDYTKKEQDWDKLKITHSTSVHAAIVAATKRILADEYAAGAIYDKQGNLVVVVRRLYGKIMIEDCTSTKSVL
jgi:hypothetical protein